MGRGGARSGAGRPGYRAKAEQLHRVDVREWARRGYLRGPCAFSWTWQRGGEPSGAISVYVDSAQALRLAYTFTGDGAARNVSQPVDLAETACTFGGRRQSFACPQCARRVGLLYLRCGRFACRHCQRVAYSSQSEDTLDRLWRKQAKIERGLDDNWQRPKGMRHHTYRLLVDQVIALESYRDDLLCQFAARMGLRL